MINDPLENTSGMAVSGPSVRLSCTGLACRRGGKNLFHGLGFTLQEGSLLILKGANGSGKTSLIKILAGLMEPEEGSIAWNGRAIANNMEYRRAITYVGHKNAVKPECTVLENLTFAARLTGSEMLLPVALRYFGLEQKQELPCGMLSAGWQRRTALSRLLFMPTPVWLLDEPTNFLDEEAILLFTNLVEARVQQGGIVIIASHNVGSAFASHTLLLEDFLPNPSLRAGGEAIHASASGRLDCFAGARNDGKRGGDA